MDIEDFKTAIAERDDAIVENLDEIKARADNLETENNSLRERIEDLEAERKKPVRAEHYRKSADAPAFSQFETKSGHVYALPATTKMADVIRVKADHDISMERWLAAALIGERAGDQKALEFANEKKQLTTGTTGVLIPEEFVPGWIDKLRSQMVLNAAGMSTMTMADKTQTHAAVATDPTVTWHAEGGAISAGNPTFAERQLVAKTAVVRCQASLELSQDSPDFGNQLLGVMARALAAATDRAGLVGSGGSQPQGLYGTSNVPVAAFRLSIE